MKFRFQDLEIWRAAIQITECLIEIADDLEVNHLFRFTEQLRSTGMSLSINIV